MQTPPVFRNIRDKLRGGKMMAQPAAAMQIREWQPEDFEALHALDRACFPPPIAYSRRTLRKFLRLPGAECLVAQRSISEDDGQIAGFILTHAGARTARQPACGHIISLDVAQQFRRCGVGSALLRAAEESLMARGVHTIDLETAVDNQPAIAFWRRHGYEIAGAIEDYYDGGGDAFAMSKTKSEKISRITSRPIHNHERQESESTCTYTRR
jgi:ribosomal-protein-alanine N-acetyltransferase